MPRRGCSGARPATPPPTSARRTCRSRRCSTAWSGTCGCRRWHRRTCSRSSTRRSRATGRARSTRTTTGDAERDRASIAPCAPIATTRWTRRSPSSRWSRGRTRREILEKLDAERKRHHRWKNLVVAATGTGKTIVAALDYKRLRAARWADPRLLFVAHRQEILKQSLGAFRQVLRDGTSASSTSTATCRTSGGTCSRPSSRLAQMDLDRLPPDAFDVVIVDEFHHAGAPTYKTPARAPAAEGAARAHRHAGAHRQRGHPPLLRWPHRRGDAAVGRARAGLLCPFQYFGVHDNTDLSQRRVVAAGYDVGRARERSTPATTRACGWCCSSCRTSFATSARCGRSGSA